MPSIRRPNENDESGCDAIPFPLQSRALTSPSSKRHTRRTESTDEFSESADDVLAAFATMSRRINDLARELKCLGYFDDDGDRPRAA